MNYQFGAGYAYAVPTAGNLPANPSPQNFGVLQEAKLDIDSDLKKLFGARQSPVVMARGRTQIKGSAKIAVQDLMFLNHLYFACPAVTGKTVIVNGEAGTVGAGTAAARSNSTAYSLSQKMSYGGNVYTCITAGTSAASAPTFNTTIGASTIDGSAVWTCLGATGTTITVAQSATFAVDYGVRYAANGQVLTKVASAPTAGQYAVSAGVYTFGDTSTAMSISYSYTVAGNGQTVTLANQLMGYAPLIEFALQGLFNGKTFTLRLTGCVIAKVGLATKQEDFWIIDVDFEAGDDGTGVVGYLYADVA